MRTDYLAVRLQTQLDRWGRGGVVVALVLTGSALVGWATGLHQLTQIFGNWPPMTPWTAMLLSGLGLSILLQSGHPSRGRIWVGRGLAVAVGLFAVMFVVEYITGRSLGIDLVWFSDGVRALQQTWPGRPSPRTCWAVLALSAGVGLTRVDRRGATTVWVAGLAVAWAMSFVAAGAYLFGALSVVAITPSTGMAVSTALCVFFLVCAAFIDRPDRWPVAWLLSRPDRSALVQLILAFGSGPLLIALIHGVLTLRSVGEETSWMVAILAASVVVGIAVFAINEREQMRRQEGESQFRSIITNAPIAIAVRNLEHGYKFANEAFCDFFGITDPADIAGRTADDLVSKLATSEPAAEVMAKLRMAEAAALRGDVGEFEQDVSVGDDGRTIDVQLFPISDGRGRVFAVGVIGSDVTERKRVESELRARLEFQELIGRAISDGRLVVFAQPIVEAHTGRLVEEELLVRMEGSDGALIAPDDFLPQARRFGVMPIIDRFMVARGIELARAGRHVAVNLSAYSISDPDTMTAITEELRQAADAAPRMSFEITETTALASMDIAQQFSEAIRSLGCRLALDDFGTGYGSFTELRGLELDTLKIDQSFIRDLLNNPRDESVVRTIVGIAAEFGLQTTAEGVEDDQTRTRLVELGVDHLQGYLIAVPHPVVAA